MKTVHSVAFLTYLYVNLRGENLEGGKIPSGPIILHGPLLLHFNENSWY